MSRFYKTSTPQFIDNIMYQPPWEMLMKAAQTKQERYDRGVAQLELLNNLKIEHKDDEVVNQQVADYKDYLNSKIDDVTNELNSTGDARKIAPKIKELQRELQNSMEKGPISKWGQTALIDKKWGDHIEKIRKDNPEDLSTALAGYNKYIKNWESNPRRDMDETLGYNDTLLTPDLIKDPSKLISLASKVKPDKFEFIEEKKNGRYIVKLDGAVRDLSKDDLIEVLLPAISGIPGLSSWAKQQQDYGLGTYFTKNKEGREILDLNPQRKIIDANGDEISWEDYKNLSKQEKEGYDITYDNLPNNSIGNALRMGLGLSYKDRKDSFTMRENGVITGDLNRAQKERHHKDDMDYKYAKLRQAEKQFKDKLEADFINSLSDEEKKKLLENKNSIGEYLRFQKPDYDKIFKLDRNPDGTLKDGEIAKLQTTIFKNLDLPTEVLYEYFDKLKQGPMTTEETAGFFFKKDHPSQQDFIEKELKKKGLNTKAINAYIKQYHRTSDADKDKTKIGKYIASYKALSEGRKTFLHPKLSKDYTKAALEATSSVENYLNKDFQNNVQVAEVQETKLSTLYKSKFVENELDPLLLEDSDVFIVGEDGKMQKVEDKIEKIQAASAVKSDIKNLETAGYTLPRTFGVGDEISTVFKVKGGVTMIIAPKPGTPLYDIRMNRIFNSQHSGYEAGGDGTKLNNFKRSAMDGYATGIINEIKHSIVESSQNYETPYKLSEDFEVVYKKPNQIEEGKKVGPFTVYSKAGERHLSEIELKNFIQIIKQKEFNKTK